MSSRFEEIVDDLPPQSLKSQEKTLRRRMPEHRRSSLKAKKRDSKNSKLKVVRLLPLREVLRSRRIRDRPAQLPKVARLRVVLRPRSPRGRPVQLQVLPKRRLRRNRSRVLRMRLLTPRKRKESMVLRVRIKGKKLALRKRQRKLAPVARKRMVTSRQKMLLRSSRVVLKFKTPRLELALRPRKGTLYL
jgi:hypothetical protein